MLLWLLVHLFHQSFISHTNSLFPIQIKLSYYAWATCGQHTFSKLIESDRYRLLRDFIQIDKESGNEIKGPPALAAKFGFVFKTDLKQKIYGDNFCFEKIIRNGIYLLLTGRVTVIT